MVENFTIDSAIKYIASFHAMAPLVALGLFFAQAILPLFPYMILAGAAGMIFGFWGGFALSWLGALLGACAAFWVSRALGKDWFVSRINKRYHFDLEAIDPKYGFWGIVIARIFPVVPTPIINVAAGVGGISFRVFVASSALGKLPTAIVYTGVGYHLYKTGNITETLLLVAIILGISFLGISHFRSRLLVKRSSSPPGEEEAESEENK